MNKLETFVFATALLAGFGGIVAVKALNEELADKNELIRRQTKWNRTLDEVIKEHLENGGELRISQGTMDKVEMHGLFIMNDMD
jgi:hypothetical protein